MGSAPVGSAHNWTESQWAKTVEHEVERQAVGMDFLGTGPNSTIKVQNELSRGKGEKVKIKFSPYTEMDGISETESAYDNAGSIDLLDDELVIDYLGSPYTLNSPMDFQRQSADLQKIVFYKHTTFWQRRFEEVIMAHLGGHLPNNTKTIAADAVSNLKFAGHNTIVATDANHLFRVGASNTTDELVAADSTAVMTLNEITKLETRAMSKSYIDYPIGPGQDGWYDFVIHPMHWEQLRTNSSAGQFEDLQLAAMKGGAKQKQTGLANGWMGSYSRTRIHVSDYVPQGVKTADDTAQPNTRRALFLGRCAGAIAFGQGYASGSHLDWSIEKFEHTKQNILVDSIFGFKTLRYDSPAGTDENYGCFNLTTYTPV